MREPGYYWVKNDGKWIIALWVNDGHYTEWEIGDRIEQDSDFEEIDERRITRDDHIWLPPCPVKSIV
jgi:hypothetical protein